MLTKEQEKQIELMYQRRLNLLSEAEEFTILKIAERVGCSKNTVWMRTKVMRQEAQPNDYVKHLEDRMDGIRDTVQLFKRRVASLIEHHRQAQEKANNTNFDMIDTLSGLQDKTVDLLQSINKEFQL